MNKFRITFVAILVALSVFSTRSNAQEKPVTFGVRGGINLSTFGGNLKDNKSTFKYQGGITIDIAVLDNLYILTGLDFQAKGTKYSPKSESNVKYNPKYLQLPMHLGYKLKLTPGMKLVVSAGPYVAYGVGGKAKGNGSSKKLFGSDKFKRLDYGVGGGVGLELGKFVVTGGYDFGLNNVSDAKGGKVKNRNAYITLGYKF